MAQNQKKGNGPKPRGFASMDPERQREIARAGGRAAHRLGTAHEFTPEEAREAGRKGGQVVSRNRAHMSEIGRKGGEASGGGRGRRKAEHQATEEREESAQQPQAREEGSERGETQRGESGEP